MAQARVTEYFPTRKRAEAQASKRLKLRTSGDISIRAPDGRQSLQCEEVVNRSRSLAEVVKDEPVKRHSTRISKKKAEKPATGNGKSILHKVQSLQRGKADITPQDSKQLDSQSNSQHIGESVNLLSYTINTIIKHNSAVELPKAADSSQQCSDLKCHAPSAASVPIQASQLPADLRNSQCEVIKFPLQTDHKFEFCKQVVLPSDADVVVTDYTDDIGSPYCTPRKKKSKDSEEHLTAKRKRKTLLRDELYHSPPREPAEGFKQVEKKKPVQKFLSLSEENLASQAKSEIDIQLLPPLAEVTLEPAGTKALRSKLTTCAKLSELKECLKGFRDVAQEIKKIQRGKEERESEEAKKLDADKSGETDQPAYVKFKDLAVPMTSALQLPHKYRKLEEMFRGADTIVSILHNRMETCTFTKLQRAVQELTRRNFEKSHLGQFATVYPEAYILRQERGIVEQGAKTNKYHLTIEACLEGKGDEAGKEPRKRKDGKPIFGSAEVVFRKNVFHHNLEKIVKGFHKSFIESLTPPMHVDVNKLTRWHPRFLLENVPDVIPSPLPEPPESSMPSSAAQVLEHCRSKLPSKVTAVLEKLASATEDVKKMQRAKVADSMAKEQARPQSSVIGISESLLQRIRCKEAMKAEAAMLRDPAAVRELEMLGRLPEMIKIIRSFFVTEKKAALLEDSVVVKLCDSFKSAISQRCIENHIEYMLRVLPKWISRIDVSSGRYLKIDKSAEVTDLALAVAEMVKKTECSV